MTTYEPTTRDAILFFLTGVLCLACLIGAVGLSWLTFEQRCVAGVLGFLSWCVHWSRVQKVRRLRGRM